MNANNHFRYIYFSTNRATKVFHSVLLIYFGLYYVTFKCLVSLIEKTDKSRYCSYVKWGFAYS
jgi:hypothetical protein